MRPLDGPLHDLALEPNPAEVAEVRFLGPS